MCIVNYKILSFDMQQKFPILKNVTRNLLYLPTLYLAEISFVHNLWLLVLLVQRVVAYGVNRHATQEHVKAREWK